MLKTPKLISITKHSPTAARILAVTACIAMLSGCASTDMPDLQATAKTIEIEKFMGDWYVVGSIPIDFPLASEAGAHNAVESYSLSSDGSIDTRYRFRKDSFDGPLKEFNPTGFIYNTETNTEWRMQFLWPFKSAYLIAYVDDLYSETLIGVPNRRYLWIMSRTPDLPEPAYQALLSRSEDLGYDISKVVRIPQSWPEPDAEE